MIISVYLPLAISVLLAAAIPLACPRLAPAPAARAVAVSAAVSAAASTWALVLLAGTLLRDAPPVAEQAHKIGMPAAGPVPGPVAMAAAAALGIGGYRLAQAVRARAGTRRALARLCGAYAGGGELVVAASPVLEAFAVPGRPGRIVVTSAMLAALDARERPVLLAHERAHLDHGHHRLRAVAEAAAALNPLLIPARTAVAYLTERWADEHAAAQVGSRPLAARSLARAALARAGQARGLAFGDLAVSRRVAALLSPPPARRAPTAALLLLAAAGILPAADATMAFARLAAHLLG